MTNPQIEQALEDIYESLANDNDRLDERIDRLKAAMQEAGEKQAHINPSRLYQNNRAGRKLLLSYFKRRGVAATFTAE